MTQALKIQIKIDQIGTNIIDKINEKLQDLSKTAQNTKVSGIGTPVDSVFSKIQELGQQIQKTLQNIESSLSSFTSSFSEEIIQEAVGVQSTLEKITDDTAETISDVVGGKTNVSATKIETKLVAPVESAFVKLISRVSVLAGSLFGYMYGSQIVENYVNVVRNGILKENNKIVQSMRALKQVIPRDAFYINESLVKIKSFGAIFSNIFDSLKKQFLTTFNIFKSSIEQMSGSIKLFMKDTSLNNFLKVFASTSTFFGIFYLFRLAKEGFTTLKKVISGSYEILTPIEHASRMVAAISNGMFHINSVVRNVSNTVKTLAVGGLAMVTGSLSAWVGFAGKAFSTVMTMIAPKIQQAAGKWFGSTKAQLVVAIEFIRTTLFTLAHTFTPIIKDYVSKVEKIKESTAAIFKDSNNIGKSKGLAQTADFLKMTKLPITAQIQSIRMELSNLLQMALQKITYLASLMEAHILGIKPDIKSLQKDAVDAVSAVDFKTKKVFIDIERYGKTLSSRFYDWINLPVGEALGVAAKKIWHVFDITTNVLIYMNKGITATMKFTFDAISSIPGRIKSVYASMVTIFSGILGFFGGIFKSVWSGLTGIFKKAPSVEKSKATAPKTVEDKKATEDLALKQKLIDASYWKTDALVNAQKKYTAEVRETTKEFKKISIDESLNKSLQNLILLFISLDKRSKSLMSAFQNIGNIAEGAIKGQAGNALRKLIDNSLVFLQTSKNINGIKFLEPITKNLVEIGKEGGNVGEAFNKNFAEELQKLLKDSKAKSLGGKISEFIASGMKEGDEKVKAVVGSLSKMILSALPEVGKYDKAGKKAMTQLATSIEGGTQKIENAMTKALSPAEEMLPKSPAKRGPLRNLMQSGKKIAEQIGDGINQGKSKLSTIVGNLTEHIMKYFPRSPAQLGALRALTTSGFKIPFMLAGGIEQGMDSVTAIVDKMAESIMKHLTPAVEMGHLSERVNVSVEKLSLLEYAFSDLKISAADMQYVMTNMQKLLSDVLPPEQVAIFEKLGINLAEIKKSADPVYNLLMESMDAISKLPPDSKLAREALEMLSVTAGTNLSLAFRRSKEEIIAMMKEGAKLGTFWGAEFVEQSKAINSLWERIKKLRDYIFKEFLSNIMPVLSDLSEILFLFLTKQNDKIRDLTGKIGKFITGIYTIFKDMVLLFNEDTDAAFEILIAILNRLYNFVGVLFGNFIDRYLGKIVDFVLAILDFVWSVVSEWVVFFWKSIGSRSAKLVHDYVISPIITGINKSLSWIIDKMGSYAPEGLRKFSESLKKNPGTMFEGYFKELDSNLDENWKGTLDNLTNKMKAKAKEIAKSGEDLFNKEKAQKALAEFQDEYSSLIDDLKKKSAGTKIADDFEKLGKIFDNTKKKLVDITSEMGKLFTESANINTKKMIGPENFSPSVSFEVLDLEVFDNTNEKVQKLISSLEELGEAHKDAGDKARDAGEKTKDAENIAIGERLKSLQVQISLLEAQEKAYEKSKGNESLYLETKNKKELLSIEKRHMEELQSLQKLTNDEKMINDMRAAHSIELSSLQASQVKSVYDKTLDTIVQYAENLKTILGGVGSIFSDLYEITGKKLKGLAIASKIAAISEATVNTAVGVTQALRTLPPPLSYIQAAMLGAQGAVQIAKIRAQGYADGGIIKEGSTERADDVLAWVSKGEVINPAKSVRAYGPDFYEALRVRAIPTETIRGLMSNFRKNIPSIHSPSVPRFADGGIVGKFSSSGSTNKAVNNTFVNFVDKGLFNQYLATAEGQRAVINVINRNKRDVGRALG